jgi:GntR family transcriptional repressor for pyruvate dehydrogenase complex
VISSGVDDRSDWHSAVPALTGPAVAGITRLTAADTVRARIALAIELGLLHADEQLPPDAEVAAALDVAEITVRRALKSLADEGVLIRRRGRNGGTFVASSTSAPVDAVSAYRADSVEVHRLIDRRVLIECTLAHYAAINATADQIAGLTGHVEAAAAAENWTDYHFADEQFHLGVATASGLPWALPHYTEVLYGLYRYFLPYPIEYLHSANEDHAQLVAALSRRDPIAAVSITERHVSVLHEKMFVGLAERDPPGGG